MIPESIQAKIKDKARECYLKHYCVEPEGSEAALKVAYDVAEWVYMEKMIYKSIEIPQEYMDLANIVNGEEFIKKSRIEFGKAITELMKNVSKED